MNERIKELLYKANGQYHGISALTGKEIINTEFVDYAKFAELIVKECYETIKKDMELAHIQLIPIDFRIYANGRLHRIIKEHFGVEE